MNLHVNAVLSFQDQPCFRCSGVVEQGGSLGGHWTRIMGGWRPPWAGELLWTHHLLPLANKGNGMTWTVQTNIQNTAS